MIRKGTKIQLCRTLKGVSAKRMAETFKVVASRKGVGSGQGPASGFSSYIYTVTSLTTGKTSDMGSSIVERAN